MKNQTKKLGFLLGAVIVITAIIVTFVPNKDKEIYSKATSEEVVGDVNVGIKVDTQSEWIDEQKEQEDEYLEELNAGDYDEDNMYVVQDPYGNSPLSALVMFKTEEKMKVQVTVQGKTEESAISHTYNSFQTKHEIPVYGLMEDSQNEVQITLTDEAGKSKTVTTTITTDPKPNYIVDVDVETITDEADFGDSELTFVVPSSKYTHAYDRDGTLRWYFEKYNSHVFKELENGHLLLLTKEDNSADTYNYLVETDYLGKFYKVYKLSTDESFRELPEGEITNIHHDAIELPSGNLLLTVNDNSEYVEDTMIEIDRESGEIVKAIDLKDILPEKFYKEYTGTTREDGMIDWFHQNSIYYDESDDSIIISGRNQDTIMKLDYKTTEIKWILSDPDDWPKAYQKYLLDAPEGFKYNAGQHAPIKLSDQDDNPDTIDILFYDNNTVISHGDEETSKDYSQGVQLRINEKDGTVEQIWSFGKEFGEDYFTNIIGSTRYIEKNDHRLVNFGYMDEGTKSGIIEVDSEGNIVFEAYLEDYPFNAHVYRAERYDIYRNADQFTLEGTEK